MTNIFLHGLRLSSFRAFDEQPETLAPFKQFNFLVGENNSGKSSVLNFISRFLPLPEYSTPITPSINIDNLDYHNRQQTLPIAELAINSEAFLSSANGLFSDASRLAVKILTSIVNLLSDEDNLIWIRHEIKSKKFELVIPPNRDLQNAIPEQHWRILWQEITRHTGGDLRTWVSECIANIVRAQRFSLPPTHLIPAIRRITETGKEFDHSGNGIVDRLAELQHPTLNKIEDKKIFDKINRFVAEVTGIKDAHIEIPHTREHILVSQGNKTLPLDSLGTGIHEIILLASFSTIYSEQIICIEEPESHLHPLLQRKLIRYLSCETTNQYFIATHSAAMLDVVEATIFHTKNDGTRTSVRRCDLRQDRVNICQDLGYRASDIVQANAIVWVEGPSDRIYVSHWLSLVAPELLEGTHYSIMFYGGRLLSHLSAEEEEINEFISLRALNQNIAVVIDSDKKDSSDCINQTKQRIVDELEKAPGIAWVTAGREIENYIDPDILQKAVKTDYQQLYDAPAPTGKFDRAYLYSRKGTSIAKDSDYETIDKVKIARRVCSISPRELPDRFDLHEKVRSLVEMIRMAN